MVLTLALLQFMVLCVPSQAMVLEDSLGQCLKPGANNGMSLAPSMCPCVGLNLLASPSTLCAQGQVLYCFLLPMNHVIRSQGSKQGH